ncbi:ATP-grasp domain-containing protein [Alkalibacter sp. M17DMB]|nr:ATP-grasp domain-containing protein [Alkalibacter mobilis]
MRLQILGGGNNQLNGIIQAKKKGHEVILVDYFDDPPGKKYADHHEKTSTFDIEGNLRVARKYKVQGIMTLGTDQPVYTVAQVAKELDLPSFLDVDTAYSVTNKEKMKEILVKNNIPTIPYRIVKEGFSKEDLEGLKFPAVMKPLDSQGQRGVFKVDGFEDLVYNFKESLSYSREDRIIVEEFYESDEITVSAWVRNGKLRILSVTDRLTFQEGKHIGICYAHRYPSIYLKEKGPEMALLAEKIVDAFKINNGPLYIQFLTGNRGVIVNELACRIGGAYEDIFIPRVTGFDILGNVIDGSLGIKNCDVETKAEKDLNISVQLFFARPGKICEMTPVEIMMELPGMVTMGYNLSEGQVIENIENATARAGFMVLEGKDETQVRERVKMAFNKLKILDPDGNDLVINMESE